MVASLGAPAPSFAGMAWLWSAVPDAVVREVAPFEVPAGLGPAGVGERVARRFFELCEGPRTGPRMMRLLRNGADSAVGGRLFVAMLSRLVFTPVLRSRRFDDAATRFELVAAQLGGIAVLRYVTRMEPVASMDLDSLVAMVAPGLQATLTAAP